MIENYIFNTMTKRNPQPRHTKIRDILLKCLLDLKI